MSWVDFEKMCFSGINDHLCFFFDRGKETATVQKWQLGSLNPAGTMVGDGDGKILVNIPGWSMSKRKCRGLQIFLFTVTNVSGRSPFGFFSIHFVFRALSQINFSSSNFIFFLAQYCHCTWRKKCIYVNCMSVQDTICDFFLSFVTSCSCS